MSRVSFLQSLCRDRCETHNESRLQSKLEAICKEVGRVVEKAPPGARLGLWFGLLRGCDHALADASNLGKEAKVWLACITGMSA